MHKQFRLWGLFKKATGTADTRKLWCTTESALLMTVTIAYLQIEVLKDELETAKEAAERAPSKTLKHLVERLRNQLALKEKQQKVMLCGYTLYAIHLSILTENYGPLWLVIV